MAPSSLPGSDEGDGRQKLLEEAGVQEVVELVESIGRHGRAEEGEGGRAKEGTKGWEESTGWDEATGWEGATGRGDGALVSLKS